jgi:hypothetical protein
VIIALAILALCALLVIWHRARTNERRQQQAAEQAHTQAKHEERRVADQLYGHERTIDVAPAAVPVTDGGGAGGTARRTATGANASNEHT